MPTVPNASVSLLRGGTASNAYGDVIDGELVTYMTHVPATLIETGQTVLDPNTQTPMIIRSSVLLVPPWTQALASDQVIDESNGDLYMVQDIELPPTTIGAPVDLKLILKRISASGV